ncbi:sulfotransferase domain-containing protein [Hyphomonas sp.]|uniref:sulfotransferase domain-containing protein n=1 Tax=Hyphomonas sp. TaxID=87 RepID=UPI0035292AF7
MIVWLASYPRSGNTFLRVLLKSCFGLGSYSQYNDRQDIADDPELAEAVGHLTYEGSWDDFYKKARDSDELYLIKTHHPPSDDSGAIYIAREPRAALVSYHKYMKSFTKLDLTPAETILGATAFGSWGEHYNAWKPKSRKKTLLLHFEEMTKDPLEAADEIQKFLDMGKVREKLPTFEELQEISPNFFRSGSNEKNARTLSDEEVNLVRFLYQNEMQALGYDVEEKANRRDALALIEATSHRLWSLKAELEDVNSRLQQAWKTKAEAEAKVDYLQKKRGEDGVKLAQQKAYADAQALAFKAGIQKEIQAGLANMKSVVDELTEALRADRDNLVRTQDFIATLTTQKIERERHIDKVEAELTKTHEKAQRASQRNRELQAQLQSATERLAEVHRAVEPRMKTLLTLRPARYILQQRQLMKKGMLSLDASGVPAVNLPAMPPADATSPVPERTEAKVLKRSGHRDSVYSTYQPTKPLGIAVYTFDRADSVEHVLESLMLQDALEHTHVFIDGDQGNPAKRARIDETERIVSEFPVKKVHRNRGNYGFRKMMIISMRTMMQQYDRMLFLEDDCFPNRYAYKGFSMELDRIEDNPDIMSVYGHHFLVPAEEEGPHGRFQGWGWATTRAKLEPLWNQLLELYLLNEEEYLAYMQENLTPELSAKLDVTPGRQPTSTLPRFFAWDEVLGFLAAKAGKGHIRSQERLIYNFGVGGDSTHFSQIEHYRKPPFNMVTMEELWQHF